MNTARFYPGKRDLRPIQPRTHHVTSADTPPRRPRQNCGAPIENAPEIIEIAALYVPDSFRQLPTICGPIFARFCLFPSKFPRFRPLSPHHLHRIAPSCALYFVYLFLIVCLHNHHIFSYLNLFYNTLLHFETLPPVTPSL